MSALHEAAQLALEALEYGQHSLKQISEYQWESRGQLAMDALKAALEQPEPEPEPQDTELSAALGWPGGISDPVLDRKVLLQKVAALMQDKLWEDHRVRHLWGHTMAHQPEPAQEPVAWMYKGERWFDGDRWRDDHRATTDEKLAKWKDKNARPLYTTPQPQRPPLTDEEMRKLWSQYGYKSALCMRFARAIERKVRGE